MDKSQSTLITIILFMAFTIASMAVLIAYQRDNDMRMAYSVCNQSRVSDTPSEELCGQVLDYYHLDFICKEANSNINNQCQVERI